jgi:hypothetical protein
MRQDYAGGPTGADYRRWAEQRERSRNASVRRDRTDPKRVAARAAEHREKAEAHMHFVAVRAELPEVFRDSGVDHYALAMREYQMAYEEEN